jgi:phospholipid/cholesterol/gamma-HCH transport system permease protein
MAPEILQLVIEDSDQNNVQIKLIGRLDFQTTANVWQRCINVQKKNKPKNLTLVLDKLDYCDGAGIGLLLELQNRQQINNHQFRFVGLSVKLQNLMTMITQQPNKNHIQLNEAGLVNSVGEFVVKIWNNIRENIIFTGQLTVELFNAVIHPRSIRWLDFWRTIEEVGPDALPLIALIGFLIGLISAFQSAVALGKFGATIYIANLVGLGLVKEMGPLMTAVLLAGRTASAFAAEIGTMKVNQEVDALTTMGLNPVKFLVIPRVLAAAIMTPLLNVFLIFFGLVGCGIVMHILGYNLDVFIKQLKDAVSLTAFFSGMIKTFVFGAVIASIGCLYGIKTRFGASAVGSSTTRSVVASIVMIVVVDGVFAVIYYVLGI